MPRIAKWVFAKEWLTYNEVVKVRKSAPSELENIFAKDESEDMKKKYKYVCTFCPRQCQTEFREYQYEEAARAGMRAHIKDHVKAMNKFSAEEQAEFLTKNHIYQPAKAQRHKSGSSGSDSDTSAKTPAKKSKAAPKREPASKKKMFTQLRRKKRTTRTAGSTDSESQRSSSDAENDDANLQQVLKDMEKKVFGSPLEELKFLNEEINLTGVKRRREPEEEEEEDEEEETLSYDGDMDTQDEEDDEEDDDDPDNKEAGCQTQTDANGKGVATLQYKMSTKLFAIDRSQWGNIEQVLEDMLKKEEEKLSDEIKARVILSMQMWMESSKVYEHLVKLKVEDPLTPQEQETLNSLTNEDWRRLREAKDDESKLRLMAYAQLLLREYDWCPRKLKPRTCRHCEKEYTASTSLNSHLVSLSGWRVWVCGRCKRSDKEEATFTRKHSLQYHILKEAGIPRYRCSEPGCSKTHNHTHHQKSHARQHTGEKHYICQYDECNGQFSNRNTYSRHLLQHHNAELTKDNEVQEIDEREAQLRVYAARLKARERSKTKRQRLDGCQTQTVEQRVLTHLLQNEGSPNSPEIEDLLKPSASQALYRVARDIRKERADTGAMGGLNLLATVSNYMNVEECKDESESDSQDECSNNNDASTAKNNNDASKANNNNDASSGNNNNKSPSYTKLMEVLDDNQSTPTAESADDSEVVSSHDNQNNAQALPASTSAASTIQQSATVISKPTVLLPLPAGKVNIPMQVVPTSQAQGLPHTIQNLKARLQADNAVRSHMVAQVIKPPTCIQIARPVVPVQPQSSTAVQIIGPKAQPSLIHVIPPSAVQIIRPTAESPVQIIRPSGQSPVQIIRPSGQSPVQIIRPSSQSPVQIIRPSGQSPVQIIRPSGAVQIIRPIVQPSAVRVIRPLVGGVASQMGTSKIIINLAQQVPVSSTTPSPSLVVVDHSKASGPSLLNQSNAAVSVAKMTAASTSTATAPAVTLLNAKHTGGVTPLPNNLFGTSYLVVAAPPSTAQNHHSQSPPAASLTDTTTNTDTETVGGVECKTIPFSQL